MKTLFGLLLSIPKALIAGFIFSRVWNWFIATKFAVPSLNYLDAVGVSIVIGYALLPLTLQDVVKDVKKAHPTIDDSTWGIIISVMMMVFIYPLAFGIAYLWHLVIR
jgi:hypothetical protein